MTNLCSRDNHFLTLVDGEKVTCPHSNCQCAECHQTLLEAEKKSWTPK
jgi:hypothetical protein